MVFPGVPLGLPELLGKALDGSLEGTVVGDAIGLPNTREAIPALEAPIPELPPQPLVAPAEGPAPAPQAPQAPQASQRPLPAALRAPQTGGMAPFPAEVMQRPEPVQPQGDDLGFSYEDPEFLAAPPEEDGLANMSFWMGMQHGPQTKLGAGFMKRYDDIMQAKRQRLAERADYRATLLKQRHTADLQRRNQSDITNAANERAYLDRVADLYANQARLDVQMRMADADRRLRAGMFNSEQERAAKAAEMGSLQEAGMYLAGEEFAQLKNDYSGLVATQSSLDQALGVLEEPSTWLPFTGNYYHTGQTRYINPRLGVWTSPQERILQRAAKDLVSQKMQLQRDNRFNQKEVEIIEQAAGGNLTTPSDQLRDLFTRARKVLETQRDSLRQRGRRNLEMRGIPPDAVPDWTRAVEDAAKESQRSERADRYFNADRGR